MKLAGAYINDETYERLVALAAANNRTLAGQCRHLYDRALKGDLAVPDCVTPRSYRPTADWTRHLRPAKASNPGCSISRTHDLERPEHVPVIGGCQPDCGHSEAEHVAFDTGVYDGEHGNTLPPSIWQIHPHSDTLIEAWETGYSVGVLNQSDHSSPQ